MRPISILALAATLFAASSAAQANNYGFTLSAAGQSVGSACNTQRCQLDRLRLTNGTSVTVEVWGDPAQFYVIGVGVYSTVCQSIPGIGNGLMMQLPVDTLSIGVLSQPGSGVCLAPQQSAAVQFTLPASSFGFIYRMQAFTVGGTAGVSAPVFTGSIDIGVQ